MYDYIKGQIVSKQLNSYRGSCITAETGGIGYLIFTGRRTIERIEENTEAKIYVSLQHKEDTMSLIGFASREERDIFNILQSVSGIGIKTALTIMDEFSITELINIMIKEDAKELSRAKGVGAKAAQKIIIELKDKLINWSNNSAAVIENLPDVSIADKEAAAEVQNVLFSLGYSASEVKNALKYAFNASKENSKSENILKYSLEYLSAAD